MRQVFIQKTQVERFNLKRGWMVTAWRVMDAKTKQDCMFPYSDTKKEAIAFCKSCGYTIVEEPQNA